MPRKKTTTRRKKVEPGSVGLDPTGTKALSDSEVQKLADLVEKDGGAVLGAYVEPFGGKSVLLVALPIDRVEPTPYQRDASARHVRRLMTVIEKIGRFLDPIIAVRHDNVYWTPNGNHRLQALKKLGAKSIVALLIPEPEMAFKILALNTEKAHGLRDKSLETVRMARAVAKDARRKESDFAFEFEEPAYLTLGLCYEKRPRISGGAYLPVLRHIDQFIEQPMAKALATREKRADQVLELDDAVSEVVNKLKERGLTSPYLKPFVLARINPILHSKDTSFDYDEVLDQMLASAKGFNAEEVRQEDLIRVASASEAEDL